MSAEIKLPDLVSMIGETAILAHAVPLPFIALGFGPLLVYPEITEVGELFSPISDIYYVHNQTEVHTLQIVTGLMSAYNLLLNEIVMFSDEQGIDHNVSVSFLCSLFSSLCARASGIPDCDLVNLAHEMTPGGYNEQAMSELLSNGAIRAWRTALDRLLKRLHENSK
jgi:pyrroline-5-carboxylate reductase